MTTDSQGTERQELERRDQVTMDRAGERGPERADLSPQELENQQSSDLPDREAMSLIDANVAAPINAAVAANILSDDSIAYANAEQDVTIDQST